MVVPCEVCGEANACYKLRGRGQGVTRCNTCKGKGMIAEGRVCSLDGCPYSGSFLSPISGDRWCATHKPPEAVSRCERKCRYEGCDKSASFGKEGSKDRIACSQHRGPDMVNVVNPVCQGEGCSVRATFGRPGSKKGSFCASHKPPGYVDVKNKKCGEEGCTTAANFNYPGKRSGAYCSSHRMEGMLMVTSKTCNVKGCRVRPRFNYEGESDGVVCSTHKEDGMVDVMKQVCEAHGCKISAGFGFDKPTHCASHRQKGMKAIGVKLCASKGCHKEQPRYNVEGARGGLYCKDHATSSMVNVTSRKCEYVGCKTFPVFADQSSKRGYRCGKHKQIGDVDVINKKCSRSGCFLVPNYSKDGKSKYCKSHAPKGALDVTHPKCQECGTRASFGDPGQKKPSACLNHKLLGHINLVTGLCYVCPSPAGYGLLFGKSTRCAKHKTPGMYPNRQRYPKCIHAPLPTSKPCPNPPYYAPPGESYPERCEDHALADDVNIVEQECQKCHLTYLIPEGEAMCAGCKDYESPKVVHAKEIRIAKVLAAAGIETAQADAPVEWGCSRKRPDFLIEAPLGFVIVLEVDENQHSSYARECEVARMGQISQDLGGLPVIFVRYNPDTYVDSLGTKVRGGTQNPGREAHLLDFLRRILRKKVLPPPVSVYYLYYDGYDVHRGPQGWELDFYESTPAEMVEAIFPPDIE